MTDKVQDLREKRAKALEQARNIVNKGDAEKRALTDEERASYDAAMADVTRFGEEIDREVHLREIERGQAAVAAQAAEVNGETDDENEARMAAFNKMLVRGARSLNDTEARALQFDNDASGGFLSPPEQFVRQLIKFVDDAVYIRQKATVFPLTEAHSLGAPSLENDPADASWSSEIGTVSEDSTMSFGKRELSPTLVAKLIKVSQKLLRSSAMPAESIIRARLGYKFAITQEKAFLTGTGASQPLGLFTASNSGISTSADVSTGNSTTAFTLDGLINAKYSLKAQYQMAGEWMFHRDAVKLLAKLKDGDGQYMWQPSVQAGQPDMLLGRPVTMSEYCPNTFTTGLYVGIFGDFSNYWIADSLAMTVQRLDELYAATHQVGFIGRMESDGMPVLEEAFARVTLA